MLIEKFRYFSVTFSFDKANPSKNVIFGDTHGLWTFNYTTETLNSLKKFTNPIARQPDYVQFNDTQDIVMLASTDDVLWVNIKTGKEIDVDDTFQLGDIKCINFKNGKFYVMANKFNDNLGYFLLEMDQDLEA